MDDAYNGFRLAEGEKLIECPYNKAHQITNARFLTHLNKCRQAYKKDMDTRNMKVEITPCRFNWAHQCPTIEVLSHEIRCQDQYSVVPTLQYHKLEFQKQRAVAAAAKAEQPPEPKKSSTKHRFQQYKKEDSKEEEENWDLQTDYKGGYNPQKKLDNDCYLYNPMGKSKSERKEFRIENRLRYQKEELANHKSDVKSNEAGGPYIPVGAHYVKIEKNSERDTESLASGIPHRKDDFSLANVKIERESEWDTETLPRSPARLEDVNDEPLDLDKANIKTECVSYDWDEDE